MPDPTQWIRNRLRFNLRTSERRKNENNRDQDIGLQCRDAQPGVRPDGDASGHAVLDDGTVVD
jgi:hypothetical protein